jgi:hypothetical protein
MIQAIRKGTNIRGLPLNPRCSLGIWADDIIEHFVLRNQLTVALIHKVGSLVPIPSRKENMCGHTFETILLLWFPRRRHVLRQ